MKPELIQTMHPDPEKTNKRIDADKYKLIKQTMLLVLERGAQTHSALMEQMKKSMTGNFEGNIPWYSETVKLDLEARKIIERSNTKPATYFLSKKS